MGPAASTTVTRRCCCYGEDSGRIDVGYRIGDDFHSTPCTVDTAGLAAHCSDEASEEFPGMANVSGERDRNRCVDFPLHQTVHRTK
ncbi:unnamed protein product [Lampetra fluviatilis]